jgi:hypothetical protein
VGITAKNVFAVWSIGQPLAKRLPVTCPAFFLALNDKNEICQLRRWGCSRPNQFATLPRRPVFAEKPFAGGMLRLG